MGNKNTQLSLSKYNAPEFWLIAGFILIVFAKFWETGVGISTTTYGALAKNILVEHNWFAPRLAPGIYDPFVEHPYFVLWIDALLMKIFGVSAQAIRLASILFGLFGVLSLFKIAEKLFDARTAFVSCFLLLFINTYMNFFNSGWLDMPMVSLTLMAYAFALHQKHGLAGFAVGLAFLSKGFGALAIIPLGLWVLATERTLNFIKFFICALLPVAAFTLLHYWQEGFFFWKAYYLRQVVAQNDMTQQLSSLNNYSWYLQELAEQSHIVFLLAVAGIFALWKKGYKKLCVLLLGIVIIHFAAYSHSSRHYRQYLLPLFPWLALAAGFFIAQSWKKSFDVLKASRAFFLLAVLYFVAVDIFPITVHSASGKDIKAFQADLEQFKIEKVFFFSAPTDQKEWEATSSYIAWYLNKTPVMLKDNQEIQNAFETLKESEALLLEQSHPLTQLFKKDEHKILFWNDSYILFSNEKNCDVQNSKKRTFSEKIEYRP